MTFRRLIIIGTILEVLYALFYLPLSGPQAIGLFIAIHTAAFVLLAYVARRATLDNIPAASVRRMVSTILLSGILFRLTLIPLIPVGSDDIYRYLWDGRVLQHGINPYQFAPADPRLASVATETLPALVNAPLFQTPYPPLAQVVFWISSVMFGSSMAGWKLLIVACDTVTMVLLLALLRRLGRSPMWVVLYAWSPLPILYFGLDGHIDALGIPFVISFLYFASQKKAMTSAVALGLSALSKLHPLFLAPFLFRELHGWRRWAAPLIPFALLAAGFLPFWLPGGETIRGVRSLSAIWEFNGSVFWIFYFLLQSNEAAHIACSLAFLGFLGIVFTRQMSLVERSFTAFVGFIALSPTVHPWYLTWLAALLVLRWSLPVFLFLGLSVLSNIVVLQYRLGMGWNDQLWIIVIEYGIPVAVGLWLWRRRIHKSIPSESNGVGGVRR